MLGLPLGDKLEIALTQGQLGILYIELGEYLSALQAFSTASPIFKSLNSPYAQLAEKCLATLRDKMEEEEFNAQLEKLVNK